MSELPQFSMKEMIEAGVHFGHKTRRWNPRMAPYLFGIRNDVHIIDLQQTVPMLNRALQVVKEVVSSNGRILFVGTKPQAAPIVAEYAKRCGQYYVNHRWLGGMLTNWHTVSASINKLRKLEEIVSTDNGTRPKQELLKLSRERDKMERALGGIKDMGGVPDALFVIDTNKESIAIKEAQILGIPIIAVVDSNSDPYGITYQIPGNDDSSRAIRFYSRLVSDAVLSGIQLSLSKAGVDIGDSAELPFNEAVLAASAAAQAAEVANDKGDVKPLKGKSRSSAKPASGGAKKSSKKDSEAASE